MENQILIETFLKILKPREKLTAAQWAEKYAYLSAESSSEHGKYTLKRTPYAREILDCFSDRKIQKAVLMSSAQIGKTTIGQMGIGYFIDMEPAPILYVLPDEDAAADYSKRSITPFIRDTPRLRHVAYNQIGNKRSNDGIFEKKFRDGSLTLVSARSPSALASKPIRVVINDEIDRAGFDHGHEGSPLKLAEKRTTTFHNRFLYYSSTPGIQGISRIEKLYESGDRRRYHVPCPFCNDYQVLMWPI